MRVAVLHNRKPTYDIPPGLPEDEYEEYDSEETVEAIRRVLEARGVSAEPMEAGRDLPQRLDGRFDFVFNIAEGRGRRCREAVPAAICELLELPYTGSDPLTLAVTLDKAIARRIVSPEVPVARAVTRVTELARLVYPVFVKPNDEGSSKGIRAESYCKDRAAAERQFEWLKRTYGCPVLVEEWLPGAEVTVAVAGNEGGERVLAMMEIAGVESEKTPFIYSLETKRNYRERVRYRVPPSLPDLTLKKLEEYSLLAYRLLGCRDIARLDFRLDADGTPCFLECNPLPGLNPESGDIVIATRSTMTYEQLVGRILSEAADRYGMSV